MAEPVPGRAARPPVGPAAPTSRPMLLGRAEPAPQLDEGVAIVCGNSSFVPTDTSVGIEIDGHRLPPLPWGRIEVPVLPGRHRFRVFLYCDRAVGGPDIVSVAETIDEVRPGELLELRYGFPSYDSNSAFTRPDGRKAFLVADPPGAHSALVLLGFFGLIALVAFVLIGGALLLR